VPPGTKKPWGKWKKNQNHEYNGCIYNGYSILYCIILYIIIILYVIYNYIYVHMYYWRYHGDLFLNDHNNGYMISISLVYNVDLT
jgi:hypothetical protein